MVRKIPENAQSTHVLLFETLNDFYAQEHCVRYSEEQFVFSPDQISETELSIASCEK